MINLGNKKWQTSVKKTKSIYILMTKGCKIMEKRYKIINFGDKKTQTSEKKDTTI